MSDSANLYDVIFRGDVAPDENIAEVKQRLAQLFGADAEKIDQLFIGRPVVLKKKVDQQTAEQYKESLLRAGAMATLRPVMNTAETEAPLVEEASPDSPHEENFELSEVGADLLAPGEGRDLTPREVDTSHLTMAATGEDVLMDADKKPFVERNVDTAHLTLDDE